MKRFGMVMVLGLLAAAPATVDAQKKKGAKEVDFIKEMVYEQYKNVFHPSGTPSKLVVKDYVFPWKRVGALDADRLSAALDSVAGRFSCKVANGELLLSSRFPANFSFDQELFSLDVEGQLVNENNEPVDFSKGVNMLNFGCEFGSSSLVDADGNTVTSSVKRITVRRSFSLMSQPKKVKGLLSVRCGLVSGYHYIKFSKDDVGKELQLGDTKLRLLAVSGRVAVLKMVEGSTKLDYLVTGSADLPYSGMSKRVVVAQSDYDFFSKPNAFDKTIFDGYFGKNRDRIMSKDAVRDVMVLKADGDIANIYFYQPNDSVERVGEVKVDL